MKAIRGRMLLVLAGLVLFNANSQADDTEIFFNIPTANIKPNLLFILDNSGSMDAQVETLSTYDSAQDYSGDFSDDYIYFNGRYDIKHIKKSVIACADIGDRLREFGKVINYKMAYHYSNDWNSFYNTDVNNSTTDCEADNDRRGVDWRDVSARDYFSANYVNWYFGHRVVETKTRLEIVQDVASSLADSMTGVNIGLMAFNTDLDQDCGRNCVTSGEGGHVIVPVADIDQSRSAFKAAVAALDHETNTPLSETLFGAMRYFQGETPFLDRNPVESTVAAGKYISPIEYECQANSVIFLTDGEPTRDSNNNSAMEAVVGTCEGNCMDEVAKYMQTTDISSADGKQTVSTYTIGFQTDQTLLSDTATKGGGAYYLADDASSLETAFSDIVRDVMAVSSTFVAPGVAVNTFNRLNHLDALYFSVFEPSVRPRWVGNLKRYKLTGDGVIYDSQDQIAVDPETGFFRNNARSWWSTEDDGPDVEKGGVAAMHEENHLDRNIYTYFSSSPSTSLSDAANSVSVANKDNITKAVLGNAAMSDGEQNDIINWTRGADVADIDADGNTAETRHFLADPLHSVPHLMIVGGTEESPETAVFFGDNQGFLHAIDGETGETYFSFMPAELLGNQEKLYKNVGTDEARPYGMDGSVISWVHDENRDGSIVAADGDHAYIYSGMRRGGRSYYALDVTDLDAPKMLWSISGGSGDFAELGQTWSKPVKTKVKIHNALTDVLIFSGGYDPQQDAVEVRTTDNQGRALYIVDAETGARLWWAGPTGSGADLELASMNYSIPASPKVLDITGDGNANQIYVGDMGGQVWRFDINNGSQVDSLVTGGVLADLGDEGQANNRRFYHSPDLFGLKFGASRYLGLIIGSGWQAHPLDETVDDRIYMLRIPEVTAPPVDESGQTTYYKLTESDLYDATDNLIQQGTEEEQATASDGLGTAKGWYIRLTRDGEKVLSTSQTVNNQVFITTYEPAPSTNLCAPSAGTSRLYHLHVTDGSAVVNYDGIGTDEALTKPDREVLLKTVGLPPDPQRMRVDDQDIICVGAECMPVESLTGVVQTYWYEE